uniref:DUF4139 domain-containing protein n=1 Tax=Heterorhabditis bacteriophora TaxID=37862 RepID=A0A1I7X351_HETBA
MKSTLRKKQRENDLYSEKIDAIERQIDQLRCGYEYDSVKRNISIIVEMDAPGSVELYVSYQVYCVSWKPAYDIRASTTAEGEQPNTIKALQFYNLEYFY